MGNQRLRKSYLSFLVVLSIISSMFTFPVSTGAIGSSFTWDEYVKFDPDTGDVVLHTNDRTATTGIKYHTKGWLVRRDVPGGSIDGPSCTPDGSQCKPLKDSNWVRLDTFTVNSSAVPSPDGTGCDSTTISGRTICEFRMSKSAVDNLFAQKQIFWDVKKGDSLYFNSIFEVIVNGVTQPGEYAQLVTDSDGPGIVNAEPWTDSSGFIQYFDRWVEFDPGPSSKEPVDIKFKIQGSGAELHPDQHVGDYETTDTTVNATLLPTITSGGQTYKLSCSYIEAKADNTTFYGCPDASTPTTYDGVASTAGDYPYFLRDGSLTTRHPGVFLTGTDVIAMYKIPNNCSCSQTVSIPDKESIKTNISGSSVIGASVPLQVSMNESKSSQDDWDTYLSSRSNIQVKVTLWRTDIGPNNTGAAPIWSTVSGPAPNTATPMNKQQVIDMLAGKSGSVPLYNDSLQNYLIPDQGKVSFRYNATVDITSDGADGTVTKTCSQAVSISIDFYRFDPHDYGTYTSQPQYWSEIKQGSPQLSGTGSDEQFEAMSGTPTTRSLFFSSGGSEFMVDIVTEYKPQTTATRNYKSEFFSVVNGWAMAPITGGWTNDSLPPAPTARQKVDACGSPFTETVSSKSQPYVKGSDSQGNPIMGTQYGWDQSGYDSHMVGGYVDTWTQNVTFDYMRIVKAQVWKLDMSKVNGMTKIIGTDQVTASVVQGAPNIFANIATANTSAGGRLRYSLETDQHDNVYWPEGNSDNCLANSKDSGPVKEQDKFTERRNLTTNVTAISDVLILQTSTGDQSVMYFDKVSNTAKTTDQLDVPVSSKETMWDAPCVRMVVIGHSNKYGKLRSARRGETKLWQDTMEILRSA